MFLRKLLVYFNENMTNMVYIIHMTPQKFYWYLVSDHLKQCQHVPPMLVN